MSDKLTNAVIIWIITAFFLAMVGAFLPVHHPLGRVLSLVFGVIGIAPMLGMLVLLIIEALNEIAKGK